MRCYLWLSLVVLMLAGVSPGLAQDEPATGTGTGSVSTGPVAGAEAAAATGTAEVEPADDGCCWGCPQPCRHCRHAGRPGRGGGAWRGRGPWQPGNRGGGPPGPPAAMESIHGLLARHDELTRTIEDIPGGVRTTTTTDNPEVLAMLRQHVGEMEALLDEGGRIRQWDPLFAEIFDHREDIEIEIEEIADGVQITETSSNEEVVKLIRAHARKVDEFVERGWQACREETPLPEDYQGAER